MKLIDIKWSATNMPKERYNILSDGKNLSIYKRYLKIFYIRVGGVYEQLDIQEAIKEYNNLKDD